MTRYIDADAVIEVQMYDEEKEEFYTEKMTVEDFICRYSEMPSIIEAEPVRHGKWIHGQEVSREYIGTILVSVQYRHWECSMCGYRTENEPLWNYCPNCGADMRGEE